MFTQMSALSFLLLVTFYFGTTDAHTLAIDLGSQTMKIAIVVPGRLPEIALNSESQRKTSTAIAFRDGARLFGNAALNLVARSPELVFQSIPSLLGKTLDHPAVKLYRRRYPYHEVSYDPVTGQLILAHANGAVFTVEELVAMLLEHARGLAESHAGEGVVFRTVVLTVPNFYGQAERRSLIRAAELAGLEVIQLIGDNTAVALHFGLQRYASFNQNAQYFMFFDVGYASTTATVVSYHTSNTTASNSGPILSVHGVGFTPTLGTSTFIHLLRDLMARKFHALNPAVKGDITKNAKSMAKLTREASDVFTRLSANTETLFQVENLFEGHDFTVQVTRSELESAAAGAFDQIQQPFMDAIHRSNVPLSAIREIVLVGGGTRVPKIQSLLMEYGNRSTLGKGVNADEAPVLGAIYLAAARTPGFRVLSFVLREYNPYPIAVFFEPAPSATAESEINSSYIHRILFTRGNPYPQKRAITFNRHTTDLKFFVNYVELDDRETNYLITTNLSQVTTVGVSSASSRFPQAELRGVKAHFTLDSNGLLLLTGVDCLFHPNVTDGDTGSDRSTLQKLGHTISGLFSSMGGSTADSANQPNTTEAGSSNSTSEGAQPGSKTNETTSQTPEAVAASQPNVTLKKSAPFTERVSFQFTHVDSPSPTDDHTMVSKDKLRSYQQADQELRDWENVSNALDSLIFHARDQLQSDVFTKHATANDLSTLSTMIETYSAWFDEHGRNAPKEQIQEKYDDIRRLMMPIESRVLETTARPEAFHELDNALIEAANFSRIARDTVAQLASMSQLAENTSASGKPRDDASANDPKPTVSPQWPPLFTDTELSALDATIMDTKSWFEQSQKKLADWSPVERPPVLVAEIEEKQHQLKREVHYLNKKLLTWRNEVQRLLMLQAAEQARATPPPPPPSGATTDQSTATPEKKPETSETERTPPPSDEEEGVTVRPPTGDVKTEL